MRTTDEKNLETLYESELDRYYAQEREADAKTWEAYKEASLDLEDELAELDYEGNPYGVIEFLKQLKQMIVEFNAPEAKKPTPTPDDIKMLQQADLQKRLK